MPGFEGAGGGQGDSWKTEGHLCNNSVSGWRKRMKKKRLMRMRKVFSYLEEQTLSVRMLAARIFI